VHKGKKGERSSLSNSTENKDRYRLGRPKNGIDQMQKVFRLQIEKF
jgi:hypothetical protein